MRGRNYFHSAFFDCTIIFISYKFKTTSKYAPVNFLYTFYIIYLYIISDKYDLQVCIKKQIEL